MISKLAALTILASAQLSAFAGTHQLHVPLKGVVASDSTSTPDTSKGSLSTWESAYPVNHYGAIGDTLSSQGAFTVNDKALTLSGVTSTNPLIVPNTDCPLGVELPEGTMCNLQAETTPSAFGYESAIVTVRTKEGPTLEMLFNMALMDDTRVNGAYVLQPHFGSAYQQEVRPVAKFGGYYEISGTRGSVSFKSVEVLTPGFTIVENGCFGPILRGYSCFYSVSTPKPEKNMSFQLRVTLDAPDAKGNEVFVTTVFLSTSV